THCGIKNTQADLAYIFVPNCKGSAGLFTRNKFVSPTITHTKKALKNNILKAVIINSGNANAGTGLEGIGVVKQTASQAASLLGITSHEVVVASTGPIAKPMPLNALTEGLNAMLAQPMTQNGHKAATAILTTDTFSKEAFHEAEIAHHTIQIAGMTKGSGMIAPNMATTLTFLATNANLHSSRLHKMLQKAVDISFNMLSVDTDTSTNDMILIFSTGEHSFNVRSNEELSSFQTLLNETCINLTKQIAKDGEGSKKMIEVCVLNSASVSDARKIALNIVNSPLVKTAIHGANPNWGRVLAAAGKDPSVKLNPHKIDLHFGDFQVLAKGEPIPFNNQVLEEILGKDTIHICFNMNIGHATATSWGCELTKGYININTDYN
ncbi:MAG: bifunctional glutamate N-acetyltransferase/amino-acid acetyltransferase ArgJ, partial [Candidatus Margulisbacteria bacterium]|nr:bifunctional glutamate N-acetyltransferase/amino-acid acetyltransferase ArgJ [Candidatus Margulisiibacteriota bacterium]